MYFIYDIVGFRHASFTVYLLTLQLVSNLKYGPFFNTRYFVQVTAPRQIACYGPGILKCRLSAMNYAASSSNLIPNQISLKHSSYLSEKIPNETILNEIL